MVTLGRQIGQFVIKGIWILLLIICTTGSSQTYSALSGLEQQGTYNIQQISTSDGLPSNVITAIVKDNHGFIWLGTPSGLCRWDGFKAIVYKHDDADSNSLIGDRISRNGLIWNKFDQKLVIGTKEGISIFDPETGIFTNHFVNPLKLNALRSPVNAVFTDHQGILWIGTDHGFARFSPKENDFINYAYTNELPQGLILDRNSINQIFDIRQDYFNDSVLWMASLAGLLKFDKKTEEIKWFYFPDKEYLREMNLFTLLVPHSDGKIYLGTWNTDMAVFDTRNEQFTERYGPTASGKNLLPYRILPYQIKSDSELWISSLEGVGVLNTISGKINFLKSFKNEKGHRFVAELFYRDNDKYWLGSEYGVFIMKISKSQFSNYFFEPGDEDHWYLTNCIFEEQQTRQLLIGYGRGEGLHIFDMINHQFSMIAYPRRSIKEFNIIKILKTSTDEIFVLATDEIYRYNQDEKKLIPLHCNYDIFPAFTDIKMNAEGDIWVASSNLGVQKFDPTNNKLISIRDWTNEFESGHELPLFQEIFFDQENRIWFRRRGESYGYYNPAKDFIQYFNKSGESFDLTSFGNPVNDTVWVSTAKDGLGFIDTKNPDRGVKLVFSSDYLKSTILYRIVVDEKNRIWGLTEKGLVKINRKSGEAVLFDARYGITVHDSWSNKNSLIPGELKVLSNGNMVIGYRRGLGFFNPDSLKILYPIPEPYIISTQVFDEDILSENNQLLKLKYDQNYISFSYSALDLYNDGISFKHKLSGIDKDWKENPQLNEVSYSNLPPGNYTFSLETSSKSGFDKTKEISLNFRILLPWWKTIWAYIAFLILILTLTFILYRFQLRRQLAHRETQRLRELDELKTRLYANITHEFRTPITVIMGMAEELSDSMNTDERKRFIKKLETIERNSSNLLHLVNQLLDLAKLEHGKLNYNPVQANIIPWLQYMVESHQSLAAAKEVQLTFYTETEKLIMDYDADHLSKVISNLLTNAIKFTDIRGKVICHIKNEPGSAQLHIKIKDDGIGIPENEQARIFDRFYQVDASERRNRSGTGIGLSLTKEIVEMIGGSISVKSQPGKGSEFEVIIPVTQNGSLSQVTPDKFEKPFIKRELSEIAFEEDLDDNYISSDKPLVLMAEDNPDVAAYIRDTIRTSYKVKWAADGEKALQMAFDLIPDIIISDVMMPGKDGYEVCNTLKQDERTNHIPVIMLTAKVTDADRISGYERGADAYLTKPFNKKELLVRLDQLLKLRRQLQAKFGKLELRRESNKPLSVEEQFIRKAAQIVEENMDTSNFNAADLAGHINLSESQLYRKLKAISGKSTALFIRSIRLKSARELLTSSTLSISEIAYQVGFNDPAWFSRVFKEEFGVSPTEARSN